MTPERVDMIRTSYKQVIASRPELFEDFYTRLFVTEPAVREMFPKGIHQQAVKLEATMQLALSALTAPETLVPLLREMGRTHVAHGVTPGQYHIVAEVLLDTLAAQAGDLWTAEVSAAWGEVLGFITNTMIEGARPAAA